jgi:hypothetical protein
MARRDRAWPFLAGRQLGLVFGVAGLLLASQATVSSAGVVPGPADRLGHWDAPIEESGAGAAGCAAQAGTSCRPVAQAMAMLKDGRVFYFQGAEHPAEERGPGGASGARILDFGSGAPQWGHPTSPALSERGASGLFCSDVTMLGDGRILMAGGEDQNLTVPTSRFLDPASGSLTPAPPALHPRWFPSLVTLPDGRALLAGGVQRAISPSQSAPVRRSETYDPATNAWTVNETGTASETSLPPHPRLFVMPNGKVLYPAVGGAGAHAGETADAALWNVQRLFDPATGKWEMAGPSPWGLRDTATSVMLPLNPPYDQASILTFGGISGPSGVANSLATLTTVDRSGEVTNLPTGSTGSTRWFSSGVSLPDGTVLALAGANNVSPVGGGELPATSAELFVPGAPRASDASAPGRWYQVASPTRSRTVHNSAVLLPDGRVLLGGHAPSPATVAVSGNKPFAGTEPDASFEIFSPHYLYRGPRAVIDHAPDEISWGETFTVKSRQALGIESAVLMRLPSPQHVNDSDARTVRLSFQRASGKLHVVAPPDGAIAPPGYYYLFLNRGTPKGVVPSVARIVHVGP